MGKKPDQIEREIAEKRSQISAQIEGLQTRVQDDVDAMRLDAKERSAQAFGDAKETLKVDHIKQMMEDHTVSTMAGAVGLGVVLGMVSEGLSSGGSNSNSSRSNGYGGSNGSSSRNGGGGGIASMLASFVGPAASTAQSELQDLVREGFGSLKGQVKQTGHEDKRVENRDIGVE